MRRTSKSKRKRHPHPYTRSIQWWPLVSLERARSHVVVLLERSGLQHTAALMVPPLESMTVVIQTPGPHLLSYLSFAPIAVVHIISNVLQSFIHPTCLSCARRMQHTSKRVICTCISAYLSCYHLFHVQSMIYWQVRWDRYVGSFCKGTCVVSPDPSRNKVAISNYDDYICHET